ncbi:MAG: hypothetical protein OXG92_10185 [Chloroflexi bacterium]|nr:hypothetical protein [Chloroflexota bacterium]MCY3583252.1 hypothetical protein [Chloroflexota bacterium]MCY3716820.1 hypothetical protein [Chloroflexota bacterium]MDE2651767.1 hypothetical protein [Chloroflexota bacterium]MXX51506.1 hypothetical protein [Chloroflexota bacterium]
MAELIPEGKTRLLVVEGQDDEVFFDKFVNHLAASSDIQLQVPELVIIQYRGRTLLTKLLREIKKAQNFEEVTHLGIVRDSDFNTDALRSVQDRIKTVNREGPPKIDVPDHPIVPTIGEIKVSVLIVPSADREGMLDDLVMDALAVDPIAPCVHNYFDCLAEKQVAIVPEKRSKATIRVFLIGKNVGLGTDVSRITDRLFLSDAYETQVWQRENLWESPRFADAKAFLAQLLAD